ncbi:hypothetical protein GZD99_005552 [Escherichia coli]|nr:hypothetical protein [Escherichia coli]EFI3479475.1 hypothetical protein [Escherichia coli]
MRQTESTVGVNGITLFTQILQSLPGILHKPVHRQFSVVLVNERRSFCTGQTLQLCVILRNLCHPVVHLLLVSIRHHLT